MTTKQKPVRFGHWRGRKSFKRHNPPHVAYFSFRGDLMDRPGETYLTDGFTAVNAEFCAGKGERQDITQSARYPEIIADYGPDGHTGRCAIHETTNKTALLLAAGRLVTLLDADVHAKLSAVPDLNYRLHPRQTNDDPFEISLEVIAIYSGDRHIGATMPHGFVVNRIMHADGRELVAATLADLAAGEVE